MIRDKKKILLFTANQRLHHFYCINELIRNKIEVKFFFEQNPYISSYFSNPAFNARMLRYEQETFKIEKYVDYGDFCSSINEKVIVDKIKDINPDLGISFGVGKISSEVIDLFKNGIINIHLGISQEYRGLDSILWAIYHRDYKNIGVTIHKVTSILNTGNIIYQERLNLRKDMKIFQLRYYATVLAVSLLIKTIKDYLKNNIIYLPQERKGRYYSHMPAVLKNIITDKFNEHCEKLNVN